MRKRKPIRHSIDSLTRVGWCLGDTESDIRRQGAEAESLELLELATELGQIRGRLKKVVGLLWAI